MPLRARSRRCSGVKVSRLPTRLNTPRAFSATRPFSSPFSLKKRPSGGSGVCVGDAGQLERLAVVEVRVAAAMRDRHRVLGRRLVEILPRQRPIELGVVEHEAGDPEARRRARPPSVLIAA